MKNNLSIQLKAAFLLAIFSLNVVVGFACSIGIDMGFNKHHHDDEMEMSSSHLSMHTKTSACCDDVSSKSSKGDDDNCCKDKVTKITTADKSLPENAAVISPIFFTSFAATFYQVNILRSQPKNINVSYAVRGSPPAIPDIRIAIQSFLI